MNIPKRGDTGPDVKALQKALIARGYPMPKYGADGGFGDETEAAIRAWQQSYHVDGTLDDREVAAIMAPIPPAPAAVNQSSFPTILESQSAVIARYGRPWDDADGWSKLWLAPVKLPASLARLTRRGELWVNRDLVDVLTVGFQQISDAGLSDKIETYDGCWNVRKIRGSLTQWSTHSWGLAIDLNAATNGMGVVPVIDRGVVEIFKGLGFIWGGEFKRLDGMHFQRVRGF